MSLKDRINDDMKAAMRSKDAPRLQAIRLLRAACQQRELDQRTPLDEAGVISIIDKLVKQRKDSIAQFSAAGRMDLADKENAELEVLQAYLPQRLEGKQIEAEVAALVAELGASGPADMGRVMGAAKTRLAGQADMAAVSAAVKRALGQ